MKNYQAFPCTNKGGLVPELGMDIRTWMAGQVVASGVVRPPINRGRADGGAAPEQAYAREVLRMTDAVIAELER